MQSAIVSDQIGEQALAPDFGLFGVEWDRVWSVASGAAMRHTCKERQDLMGIVRLHFAFYIKSGGSLDAMFQHNLVKESAQTALEFISTDEEYLVNQRAGGIAIGCGKGVEPRFGEGAIR